MSSRVPHKPRLFLLALDGATFDLLEPWMSAGHLPNLRKLYASGVRARLESTYPPLTAPAWASFMTGKSPGRHGLLEFFKRDPGSYRLLLNSRNDIDGRTIWRVLSDAEKEVGVLGVPLTWPPEAVRGFIVTGLLTPRDDHVVFTHPPELGHELNQALGKYLLQHTEKYVQSDPQRLVDEEHAILENKFDAALYLLDAKKWDFFMLHLLGGDVLQHGFWHFMDPTHRQHTIEGGARFGNVILDYYKRLDARLPELLARLPSDCYVMLMSDHGFGPLELYINFNTWLLNKGFLKIRRNFWSRLRLLAFRLGYSYSLAWNIGSRTGIVRRIIRLGRGQQEQLQRKMFLSLEDVDWNRTKVYSVGNFGQMYVNLRGREPQGWIEPGENYEQVLQELEDALRELRDPYTDEPVIEKVWRGSELWEGPYAEEAPDLFFFTRDMQYKAMGLSDFGANSVFEDLYGTRAHHRMDGIFMLSGPGIRQNADLNRARLIDLAPTIFHLQGVPIPRGSDGEVLMEAFDSELASRAPEYETMEGELAERDSDQSYTPEEEAALTQALRDLGYVS